jgi:hypothetical protein
MARSIGASLAAYLGVSGATVVGEDRGKLRVQSELSALNPVSKYAGSYVPPETALDLSRPQSLKFDIIGWRTDKSRQIVSTPVLGQITVKRSPSADAVEYEIVQELAGGEKMTGRSRCLADPRRSLTSWQFEHVLSSNRKIIAGMTRTRQSGKRQGDKIAVVINGAETVTTTSTPLLCRWGLMDVASRMSDLCRTKDRYTVLHEPSGLRPDQRFREDRSGVLGNGKDTLVRTYLQTGPATVPTHWIVDSQGRPLFVSAFLVSWALKAIS